MKIASFRALTLAGAPLRGGGTVRPPSTALPGYGVPNGHLYSHYRSEGVRIASPRQDSGELNAPVAYIPLCGLPLKYSISIVEGAKPSRKGVYS